MEQVEWTTLVFFSALFILMKVSLIAFNWSYTLYVVFSLFRPRDGTPENRFRCRPIHLFINNLHNL